MPNRLYMHAATSQGYAVDDFVKVFTVRTIFDNLSAAGRSWRVYYSDINDLANVAPANRSANFRLRSVRLRREGRRLAQLLVHRSPVQPTAGPSLPDDRSKDLKPNAIRAPDDVRPARTISSTTYTPH